MVRSPTLHAFGVSLWFLLLGCMNQVAKPGTGPLAPRASAALPAGRPIPPPVAVAGPARPDDALPESWLLHRLEGLDADVEQVSNLCSAAGSHPTLASSDWWKQQVLASLDLACSAGQLLQRPPVVIPVAQQAMLEQARQAAVDLCATREGFDRLAAGEVQSAGALTERLGNIGQAVAGAIEGLDQLPGQAPVGK